MKLTHRIHVCLIILFNYFNSLFRYNKFTELRQNLLHFDSIMNLIHYESINVIWANDSDKIDVDYIKQILTLWKTFLL